jgi:hypothetical protein
MSVPGRERPRPAPAMTERAWAEMPTGRRRWATASLSGTSSGQTGPRFPATPRGLRTPEHRSFRCVPIPLAGSGGLLCVSAGTSREDCGEPSPRHRLPSVPPVTARR